MGVGATIATGLGYYTNGVCLLDPFFGSKNKTIEPRLFSNPIEFDGIKIQIIKLFPDAQKLYGITIRSQS